MKVSELGARLLRWLLVSAGFAAFGFGLAGRTDLPMLRAFVGMCVALSLFAVFVVDADLARERLRPGQKGEDPVRLALIRLTVLATFVVALLDIGRFHWSDSVPRALQWPGLVLAAVGFAWSVWAISVNRFFVPVIRVQPERGQHIVSDGPYARVRHPGYAGLVFAVPGSAAALGSWWGLGLAAVVSFLFWRRAAHEDRFLGEHLEGYADYSRRVRYRLVPGVW